MINQDFAEFPEHRVGFFKFLRAVDQFCFPAIVTLPGPQFKLVVDSAIWAIKHSMRDIAEIGLNCESAFSARPSFPLSFYRPLSDSLISAGCRTVLTLFLDFAPL